MKTVTMLEDDDIIKSSDWIRYVDFDGEANRYNVYSGIPENNTRWLQVSDMFGNHLIGKTVKEFNHMFHSVNTFEFIRGDILESNVWNKCKRNPD